MMDQTSHHLKRVVHHVGGSWNSNRQGDFTRPFKLERDRLVISGAPGIAPRTSEEVVDLGCSLGKTGCGPLVSLSARALPKFVTVCWPNIGTVRLALLRIGV
jgi:hypothetical protein